MPPVTFTPQPQDQSDSRFEALAMLHSLTQSTRSTAPSAGSPWMAHGNNCRCLLCG